MNVYIDAIPVGYRDFDVQRGIVSNKYLDHLVDTVANKKHIPPIVLVVDDLKIEKINDEPVELVINDFKILDGLQRTHRLKVMHKTLDFVLDNKSLIDSDGVNSFLRKKSREVKEIGSNRALVKSLSEYVNGGATSLSFFSSNKLWLEVWHKLDSDQQIQKMLLLNAGHKSVNIKHQLELLFLSTLVKLESISPSDVTYIREREQSAIQYSKKRELYTYHFSHIISALISVSAGKVVNTNNDFIGSLQSGHLEGVELVEGFKLETLELFMKLIYSLDKELERKFGDLGVKWLGREVVVVGFFGAIGYVANENSMTIEDILIKVETNSADLVDKLDLNGFEYQRNNVELNKVNIGNINKKAVFAAIKDIVGGNVFLGWDSYFRGGE